jgi:hypothetical protein
LPRAALTAWLSESYTTIENEQFIPTLFAYIRGANFARCIRDMAFDGLRRRKGFRNTGGCT